MHSKIKPSVIIGIIVATLITSTIAAAVQPVSASDVNCDEEPNDEYCTGERGAGGMIFCDEEVGFKSNCYDRNDNPKEYCDNYAIEESSKVRTAEFCQAICNNYQNVIAKGEDCKT